MTYRADTSTSALSIIVDAVASPAGDVQATKLLDPTAGSASPIGVVANPLIAALAAGQPGQGQVLVPGVLNTSASAVMKTGVGGKRFYVYSIDLTCGAAGFTIQFQSGTGPIGSWVPNATRPNLSGQMSFPATGGIAANGTIDSPLFWTEIGDSMAIILSGAVSIQGHYAGYFA